MTEPRHADSAAFAPAPGESGGEPAVWPGRALARLYSVAAIVAVASLIPYMIPALVEYRYWDRLDAEPLVRALTLTPPTRPTAVAGPAQSPAPPTTDDDISDQDIADLAGVPTTLPDGATRAAGLPGAATGSDPLDIGDDVLGDQKVWLQGDLDKAAPFWRALRALAKGERKLVRIGHWGDSHIANDGITQVTRLLLHKRFGDGGHGYTLVQGRTEWYVHKGIERTVSEGWRLLNFLSGNARDGAYGYGGVSAEGAAGEQLTLTTNAKTLSSRLLLYYRSLGKASVTLRVDGKALDKLDVSLPAGSDAVAQWQVPDGKHSITWRVTNGRIRIHGAALERDQGIVYDSLGEVGARGTRWTQADAEHLKTVMAQRAPDLLIFNYGGNERQDPITEATYTKKMGEVIERLMAGRRAEAACLILGPSDHGVREKGKIVSDPAIVRIIGWQKNLATSAGCVFLDARAIMGGEGSMGRWVKDGLGWADYSHFTAAGERVMGQATYRALLEGYRRWAKAQAPAPARP